MSELLGYPVIEIDEGGTAEALEGLELGISLGGQPLEDGQAFPIDGLPEIAIEGQGRPPGPAIEVVIEANGRELAMSLPPGLPPGAAEAMAERMAQAAAAMSYVPDEYCHDWPLYEQAIDDLSKLWALPRDEAQEHFAAWVKSTIYSWGQAYWLARAGNREALEPIE